jgi:cytochrome c oxidase subunit 3
MNTTTNTTTNFPVAHHFDFWVQQRESVSFGMWIFLVTEVMFFGGIFFGYSIYRFLYPEMFHDVSRELDVFLGALNTGVLLTSSLTMALAVNAAQTGKHKRLVAMLWITVLCGLGFLGIKTIEYSHKFEHGMVPGSLFHWHNEHGNNAQIFLSFYFGATGLHGFHVLIGIILIAWFAVRAMKGAFPKEKYQPVEMLGLYWHFVDLVWIYVFPLFYLIGRN